MNGFLLVAAGGALGAMLRHSVGYAAVRLPLGGAAGATLLVNIVGSALMGVLMAWLMHRQGPSQGAWLMFLGTGLLGGFTTFSAFSREVVIMMESGAYMRALSYALVSVIVSVLALMAAFYITRKVLA